MAYFPAAYKKVFVVLGAPDPEVPMEEMTSGMFGFFDAKTWAPIPVSEATVAQHPKVIFAMADPFHTTDKIGIHGGYKESIKSQVIDASYIDRVWKSKSRHAYPHRVFLGWNEQDYSLIPEFYCGKTYTLRLDVKGSQALRYLGHNLYRRFTVTTPCCSNPVVTQRVDPIPVLLEFARQIQEDPFFGPFATVFVETEDMDGYPAFVDAATYVPVTTQEDIINTVAGIQLILMPTDTTFDYCSFDPLDQYETEPLILTGAQWVDAESRPCTNIQPLAVTTSEVGPLSPEGTPGLLLREFLLFMNYRQEIFSKDLRRRDVQQMDQIAQSIYEHDEYWSFYIQHRVPRKYNPSGVYDQDQYLNLIAFPEGSGAARIYLTDWINSYLASANNGLVFEDVSGYLDQG